MPPPVIQDLFLANYVQPHLHSIFQCLAYPDAVADFISRFLAALDKQAVEKLMLPVIPQFVACRRNRKHILTGVNDIMLIDTNLVPIFQYCHKHPSARA